MWAPVAQLLRSPAEVIGALLAVAAAAIFGTDLLHRALVECKLLGRTLSLATLTDGGKLSSWPRVQYELRKLLALERTRLLYLHATSPRAGWLAKKRWTQPMGKMPPMPPMKPMGSEPPQMVLKDLVLIGGGHSHVHVLKMFGLQPERGVQITLITRDVDTPYSGMLPGYVAGMYTWRECHIDLAKMCAFARVRLVHAEAEDIDTVNKRVILKGGRPPIRYDVLSVDIGSAPKPVATSAPHPTANGKLGSARRPARSPVRGRPAARAASPAPRPKAAAAAVAASPSAASAADALAGAAALAITPVKPIDGFCKRWVQILERVLASDDSSACRIVVVGGGAGGVELALSMQARLQRELVTRGRTTDRLEVALVSRSQTLLPQHSTGVRAIFSRLMERRGVNVVLGAHVTHATPNTLHIADGGELPFEEAIWCTQGGAAEWLKTTSLQLDDGGFIAVHPTLESVNTPGVFACGDVAAVLEHPRPKAGVFAVRQGPPLTNNLRRALLGKPPLPFTPQSSFLGLIGAGDGQCVASRGNMALEGAWLWTLKDWIDRTWMLAYTDQLPTMHRVLTEPGVGVIQQTPPPAVAAAMGGDALDALSHASMRCGGCGAKVGASTLSMVMRRLREGGHLPPDGPDVLVGLDAPDDCAVLAPAKAASIHTVDFFRAFVNDGFVFGQISANHALSDCHAMGARPTGALAIAVVPYGLERKVEEDLFQMMAGAAKALTEAGCPLLGGHSCEGVELSLGFSITGQVSPNVALTKAGLASGQVLILTKPVGTGVLFAAHMRGAAAGAWVSSAIHSMVSSNAPAAKALLEHGATACTDVTGFGLLGHLIEMAGASGARVALNMGDVPLLPGAAECVSAGIFSSLQPANLRLKRAVANEAAALKHPKYPLLFDPQTSGGLLAAVPARRAAACIAALRRIGFGDAAVIGEVIEVLPEGTCAPTLVECRD